jgi:hypothetical protein
VDKIKHPLFHSVACCCGESVCHDQVTGKKNIHNSIRNCLALSDRLTLFCKIQFSTIDF